MKMLWILLLVLGGSLTGYLITRFEQASPILLTRQTPVFVGAEHSHEFRVTDVGTGIEMIRVWIQSGDVIHELANASYPGSRFTGAKLNIQRMVSVTVRPRDLGLPDGQALLHAEATDFSWIGNHASVTVPLVIDTRAPRISLRTGISYVRRGGAGLTVYRIHEGRTEHGVQLGDLNFPGFPHPSDPAYQVAFYAWPPDVEAGWKPRVVATDRALNTSSVPLQIETIERSFPEDEIELSASFMQQKVDELGSQAASLLEAYLSINRNLRAENAQKIREVCQNSGNDRLWRGAFRQLPNSQVGARFAERRSYRYQGREVDTQLHLGYDLASTRHASVPAANDGVVVFAEPLGIYGNTVILDHGLGLFSLYGHLSEIAVEKGQVKSGGDRLGATGTTGLAGGDHLHFAMLINGVPVDPLEWFDPRWIREHVEAKLSAEILAQP